MNIPTLYRTLRREADVRNHLLGKLWFRSLKHFREVELPGRDPLEGVGSYTVHGMLHRDVSDEYAIFPAFILCFSERPLKEHGDFVLKLRRPLALRDRVLSKFPDGSRVEWHQVEYGKKEVLDSVPGLSELGKRKHYTKPADFAHEREWRLVVFLPPPFRLLNDTIKPHVGNLQGVSEVVLPRHPS